MKRWSLILLTLLLAACGGKQVDDVSNPYADRMRELSKNGVIAMQRERWDIAGRTFERALKAAKLANDRALVAQAWYNLGVVHSAVGEYAKAEEALHQAEREALGTDSDVLRMRARLALALVHQKQGKKAWQPDSIASSMPVDVQLSAARLMQLKGNHTAAAELYWRVVKRRAKDRRNMIYQAEAHMGLAMLAEAQKDGARVMEQTARVLEIARKTGIPRLAAHAYLLMAGYSSPAQSRDAYRQAADLYQALDDTQGLKKALQGLIALAERQGDREQVESLSRELEELVAE